MKYELIPVPISLQPFVRTMWTLEGDAMPVFSQVFGSLVDGCPGMIFHHANGGHLTMDDKPLPGLFLYGQTTKHADIIASEGFRTTGVIFHPHALKTLFNINAAELTNTCINPDLLSSKKISSQLSDTVSLNEQVKLIQAYIHTQVSNKYCGGVIEYAVSRILSSNGNISMRSLQEELQITEKSLERNFKAHVGISPKMFAGICRYQSSLQQLRSNQYLKLSDIAYENEYADQSHFIRSFKKYTGCSPFQFQKQFNDVSVLFNL
jgi:AraC-like DNA-binding protein